MEIYDLDMKEPICDSYLVRLACGNPSNHSWALYRRTVRIPKNVRLLTQRQSFLVWVAANLYRNGRRKLDMHKVQGIANELLKTHSKDAWTIVDYFGGKQVSGRQFLQMVDLYAGKSISRRTVYRKCNETQKGKVPSFSTMASYSTEQIRRMLRAIVGRSIDGGDDTLSA